MMRRLLYFYLLVIVILPACIGEDVIEDLIPESIKITADPDTNALGINDSIQFTAQYFDDLGKETNEYTILWKSSDTSLVKIDSITGLAVRDDEGPVVISACANGISQDWSLDQGVITRTGTFDNSYSSYKTIGTVSLEDPGIGDVVIHFHADTDVGSGPKLYMLLANVITNSYAIENGGTPVNATFAQITPNIISSPIVGENYYYPPDGVNINDYQYVVFYCDFGVVFGYATLD